MANIPFVDLPPGCAKLSFNPANFVPAGFTLCTTPLLPDVTFAPTPFHIDIVGDLPPPYCPCIPEIAAGGAYNIDNVGTQVIASLRQYYLSGVPKDCCDPKTLQWSMNVSVPCLPLSVKNKVKVKSWQGTSTLKIRKLESGKEVSCDIRLSKVKNTCQLALQYKIVLPCMPYSIHVSRDPAGVASGGNPGGSGINNVHIEFVKGSGDCAWKLKYKVT